MKTRVGQAYVAITADGSGINDEIAEAFEDVDYDRLGERSGKRFGKKYRNALRNHLNSLEGDFNKVLRRLDKALETDAAITRNVRRQLTEAFTGGKLDNVIRHVGEEAGVKFGSGFDDVLTKTVRRSLERSLKDAARSGRFTMKDLQRNLEADGGVSLFLRGPALDRVINEVQRKYRKALDDNERMLNQAHAENLRRDKKRAEDFSKMWAQAHAMNIKWDQRVARERQRRQEKEVRDYTRMWAQAHAMNIKWDKRVARERERLAAKAEAEQRRRSLYGSVAAGRVARSMGRGTRSDFLHYFGTMMGGAVAVTEKFTRSLTLPVKLINRFSAGMATAGRNASLFQRVMAGFGAGGLNVGAVFSRLAAAGPAAILALVAVGGAMSAVVSAASALLALLTALVGAIAGALVGALAVGGAMLTAFAGTIGLVTLAFMSMTDAQKKALGEAFTQVRELGAGIGQLVFRGMRDATNGFQVWSDNVYNSLALLIPMAERVGAAFGEAGNIITASFSGPGFQKLAESLTVWLPSITTNMATAMSGFLNGLMGLFAAIMPQVARFAEYLGLTAQRFSEWANSAIGQSSIQTFVDEAVQSLLSLWNFTREFFGFFSDLFFNDITQNAGQSIFDSMAEKFASMRDQIAAWAADGTLQQWFDSAIQFGGQLWGVLESIWGMLQSLNDPQILAALGASFEALGYVIDAVAWSVDVLTQAFGWALPDSVTSLVAAFSPLLFVIDQVIGLFTSVGDEGDSVLAGRLPSSVSRLVVAFNPLIAVVETLIDLFGLLGASGDSAGDRAARGLQRILPAISPGLAGVRFLAGEIGLLGPTAESSATRIASANARSASSVNPVIGAYQTLIGYIRGAVQAAAVAQGAIAGAMAGMAALRGAAPPSIPIPSIPSVQNLGRTTIPSGGGGGTGGSVPGGGRGVSAPKQWKNPYEKWANSLIKDGPSTAQELKRALKKMNKQVGRALTQAAKADELREARSILRDQYQGLRRAGREGVKSARDALNSAAQDLANAGSKKEAQRALREVRIAQRDLRTAQKNRQRLNRASNRLDAQRKVNSNRVNALLRGETRKNATLAEYARARERLNNRIERANERLTQAIALRDNYRRSVTESVKQFGSLMTAQAQVIDGVEQALTATDIVDNLQDRLGQIEEFQKNLRVLLALGLSKEAYDQIVSAGVSEGGAFAAALLEGGVGMIQQVSGLTSQIGAVADALGLETSNEMYQAGVDAAQGLLEGLESLGDKLDAAGARLGKKVAKAIRRALGIKSPSRVLIADMEHVGDGAVIGLDNQHPKVEAASQRFAEAIAVSPEVAAYAASQRASATVSGNGTDPRFRDLVINTPTENPKAVAYEVLNEVTGRL